MFSLREALRTAALLVPFGLSAAAGPVRAACPISTLQFCGFFDCIQPGVSAPSSNNGNGPWTAGTPCNGACFDLPHGTVHGEGSDDASGPGNSAGAIGADTFMIQNVGGTDPVPAIALFLLDGSTSGNSQAGGYIQVGGDPSTRVTFFQTAPVANFSHELRLNVQFIPGQPLLIEYSAGAGGNFPGGSAKANGRLLFANLPDGAYVTSCWQYNQFPVPAGGTSWGKVKATYR